MSCLSSTAPIDIDPEKQSGVCDLKCNYQFKYSESISTATNRGDYLSINYEPSSTSAPVRFNSYEYTVSEIRIYTPSLHSFRDHKTIGECIVVHTSNSGNSPLLVCVPIVAGNSATSASQYLSTVIQTMSKTAPVDGDATLVNTSFNLDVFVPSKPFFSYTATQPYQPCQGENHYVVFLPTDSNIHISSEDAETLSLIIEKNAYTVTTSGPSFYYNADGPSHSFGGNDDIYIDCQPVGESEEKVDVVSSESQATPNIFQGDMLKFILICLLFILLLYVFNYFLTYLGGKVKHSGSSAL